MSYYEDAGLVDLFLKYQVYIYVFVPDIIADFSFIK